MMVSKLLSPRSLSSTTSLASPLLPSEQLRCRSRCLPRPRWITTTPSRLVLASSQVTPAHPPVRTPSGHQHSNLQRALVNPVSGRSHPNPWHPSTLLGPSPFGQILSSRLLNQMRLPQPGPLTSLTASWPAKTLIGKTSLLWGPGRGAQRALPRRMTASDLRRRSRIDEEACSTIRSSLSMSNPLEPGRVGGSYLSRVCLRRLEQSC